MSHLKALYRTFIRAKVNQEHIIQNPQYCILGENFIRNQYFMVIADVNDSNDPKTFNYHLLIENPPQPDILALKVCDVNAKYIKTRRDYIISKRSDIFQTLVKQGFYFSQEKAYGQYNSTCLIHRLTACLYENITGLEIHHNNKEKTFNAITNLTPLPKEIHEPLDKKQGEEFVLETEQYHNAFRQRVFREKRNTLASRDNIIFDILQYLHDGKSVVEINKILKGKIGCTKIQEIKNYYFYLDDFFKYLYSRATSNFSAFNDDFGLQWLYPLRFDWYEEGDTFALDRFLNEIAPILRERLKNHTKCSDDVYCSYT